MSYSGTPHGPCCKGPAWASGTDVDGMLHLLPLHFGELPSTEKSSYLINIFKVQYLKDF